MLTLHATLGGGGGGDGGGKKGNAWTIHQWHYLATDTVISCTYAAVSHVLRCVHLCFIKTVCTCKNKTASRSVSHDKNDKECVGMIVLLELFQTNGQEMSQITPAFLQWWCHKLHLPFCSDDVTNYTCLSAVMMSQITPAFLQWLLLNALSDIVGSMGKNLLCHCGIFDMHNWSEKGVSVSSDIVQYLSSHFVWADHLHEQRQPDLRHRLQQGTANHCHWTVRRKRSSF